MTALAPGDIARLLSRIDRAVGGQLLTVSADVRAGRVARLTWVLALRDSAHADAPARLTLELSDVTELRWQVRVQDNPTELEHGVHIGHYNGQFFIDLKPWDDQPDGVHDFRASACYAAADRVDWLLEPIEST